MRDVMKFQMTRDINSSIYNDSLTIRKTVFIEEQQVDEALEIDELESQTLHVVGYDEKEEACCTARLYEKETGMIKVQRVAVLSSHRGKCYGRELLNAIEDIAKSEFNAHTLVLDAQDHAIPFYEKSHYTVYGGPFLDANIPHHHMKKEI